MRRAASAMSSCCHTTTGIHPAARSCTCVSASRSMVDSFACHHSACAFGRLEVLRTPVPEAAVDVHSDPAAAQHHVRSPAARGPRGHCVDEEAQPERVRLTPERQLRCRSRGPLRCSTHRAASLLAGGAGGSTAGPIHHALTASSSTPTHASPSLGTSAASGKVTLPPWTAASI